MEGRFDLPWLRIATAIDYLYTNNKDDYTIIVMPGEYEEKEDWVFTNANANTTVLLTGGVLVQFILTGGGGSPAAKIKAGEDHNFAIIGNSINIETYPSSPNVDDSAGAMIKSHSTGGILVMNSLAGEIGNILFKNVSLVGAYTGPDSSLGVPILMDVFAGNGITQRITLDSCYTQIADDDIDFFLTRSSAQNYIINMRNCYNSHQYHCINTTGQTSGHVTRIKCEDSTFIDNRGNSAGIYSHIKVEGTSASFMNYITLSGNKFYSTNNEVGVRMYMVENTATTSPAYVQIDGATSNVHNKNTILGATWLLAGTGINLVGNNALNNPTMYNV